MNRDIRFPSLTARGAAIMGALAAYITPPPPRLLPSPKRRGGKMRAAGAAPLALLATALAMLAVAGALFTLYVHPAYAQDGSVPAKPTGLYATATHDQVILTWDDPGDDSITGYVILRRVRENDVGGEFSELVADTGTAATTYTDDTVAASTTYTYRIKAINESGVSERSRWFHIDIPAAPERPDKPTGLSATATHNQVVLTWDDPNDDSISGYVILRRVRVNDEGGDFSELVADTGSATTTYTDDEVVASTTYTYRIKAINEHGVSERSRWYHIDTPAEPEPAANSPATGAPAITGAAQVGETLTVDTSGIADEDGLENATFSYQWLADGTAISGATANAYTPVEADEGQAITVQVTFTDDAGNEETLTSAATDAVAAAQPTEPPAKPTDLSATATHNQVVLTWKDPNDDSISGYVILRRVRVNDEGGDFSELVADTGSATTTYTDDEVVASTTYTYRIKAINEHGVSERSRWYHIVTLAAPVASQRTQPYVDVHNAGVHDLEEFRPRSDSSNRNGEVDEEDAEPKAGKQSKSGGSGQGKNITPRATVNICGRTPEVVEAILESIDFDLGQSPTCSTVTDAQLAGVTYLYLEDGYSRSSIRPSDFAGLTAVEDLRIKNSPQLTSMPARAFDGLPLTKLDLGYNRLSELDQNAFSGLQSLTTLDLKSNELRLLEPSLFNGLQSLTTLDLGNNELEMMHSGAFSGLDSLTTLDLRSNRLRVLDADAFNGLDSLTTLNLRSNRLRVLDPDAFNGLPALSQLYLTSNTLTWLPVDVFDGLSSLERLDLNNNGLTFLPEDIFDGLANLTTLLLTQNALTSLEPGTFDGLSSLRSLDLQYNQLSSLDRDIFLGLSSLIWLGLEHNQLSSLPTGIFDSLPLTRLFLDDNQLTWLSPDTFRGLSKLRTLHLENNDLGSLHSDIFEDLADLSTLHLENIGLTSLPEDIFENNPELSWLYLNDNQLSSLPEDLFDGLSKLSRLHLYDNRLSSLPEDLFDGLSSLERLYLERNRLTTLPADIFEDLAALENLWLDTNRLTTLPADIFDGLGDTLIELTLSDNSFRSLPEDVFEGLNGLFYLLLHRSGLTELDSDLFDPLTSLWLLYLHGNGLTELPEDIFDGHSSLARLYLHGNDLTELPVDVFDGLTGLQRLYLDGNKLTTLDADVFDGLRGLQQLYLYSNGLSSLPASVFEDLDSSLGELYLQDNDLTALPDEIFDGLTGLKGLDLSCNALTALELDVFDPFAGTLTYLDLDANPFAPPPTEAALRAKLTTLEALYLGGDPPCLPAFDTGLSALTLSTGTLFPEFESPGISVFGVYPPYRADVGDEDSLTVTTATESPNAAIGPSSNRYAEGWQFDNDRNIPGLQVDLNKTLTEVWWQVTAENPSYTEDYAVEVFREHPRPAKVSISVGAPAGVDEDAGTATVTYSLTIRENSAPLVNTNIFYVQEQAETATRDNDYTPPAGASFGSERLILATLPPTAFVQNAAGTAWVAEGSFDIGIIDDADREADETIVFRAESRSQSSPAQTITIRDDDATPSVSIVATYPTVAEEQPARFTLTRTGATRLSLAVAVTLTEQADRDLLPEAAVTQRTVTFAPRSSTATLAVELENDRIPEPDGNLSAAVQTSTGYMLGDPSLASVTVEDGDSTEHTTPTVSSVVVASAPQSGTTYHWGETILFTVTFGERVRVTGRPWLEVQLDNPVGASGSSVQARFYGLSETEQPGPGARPASVSRYVHFAYTVQAFDRDADGIGIDANALRLGRGGRIRSDDTGTFAEFDFAALNRQSGHRVDGRTTVDGAPAAPDAEAGIAFVDRDGNPLQTLADGTYRLEVPEGGEARYGLRLKTQPTHSVYVGHHMLEGDVDLAVPRSLWLDDPITPDEWDTKTIWVRVEAAQDADAEHGERVFANSAMSNDPNYHHLVLPDVIAVEVDDD